MGHLDEAFYFEDQLGSLWDFQILESVHTPKGCSNLKFKVTNVNIPFLKLRAERNLSSMIFYESIEDLEPITITFRESVDFSTYDFFYKWREKVYNSKKRVFNVVKSEDEILYDICITFFNGVQADNTDEWTAANSFVRLGLNGKKNFMENSKIENSKVGKKFIYRRCRILGIDQLSLDYDSSSPVSFSVTIMPESMD